MRCDARFQLLCNCAVAWSIFFLPFSASRPTLHYMLQKLTDQVWFGNWEAPFECIGQVGTIINVAHHFNPRRGRDAYWRMLEDLPWDVLYFRLAKKDRQDIDDAYAVQLACATLAALESKRLPILCHCQMGHHRGPTAALYVAWHLSEQSRTVFEQLHARLLELSPGLDMRGRNYYRSTVEFIRKNSVNL